MDFGKVIVTDQARTLTRGMPGRAGGKLTFLNEQNIRFAFLCEVVGQSHAHDPATDNNNLGLCFHGRRFPSSFLLRLTRIGGLRKAFLTGLFMRVTQ